MPENSHPVKWAQEDYLKVAGQFINEVSSVSFDEWKIHALSFTLNCEEISFGPQMLVLGNG